MIDLRSDTVTRPGPGMRRAMAEAEVGDDVFGEDPTVLRLQERVAELLGKEAALYVPSGVMGNQISLRVHTSPGDEVLLEASAHIGHYESAAGAALSGVQLRCIPGKQGILDPEDVSASVRAGYYWEPRPRLLCVENTANKAGGTVYPLDRILELADVASHHGLAFHLDGARLWNASAASGVPEADYAAPFDSVSVCLSKGLGAPVGSVVAGSAAFIKEAHRYRKMYGGGMRQVGVLAAAGLYALDNHRDSLPEDHEKAATLAEGLAQMPRVKLDPSTVESNIVIFDVDEDGPDALQALEAMRDAGVLMVPFGPRTIRATTHRDVSSEDIKVALTRLSRVL